MHQLLVDFAQSEEQVARQSRFASIDVPDDHHVDSTLHRILIDGTVVLHLGMGRIKCVIVQDVVHHGGLRVYLGIFIVFT